MDPTLPLPILAPPLFGSRRRDVLLIGLIAVVMTVGVCTRVLVYYQNTVVTVVYEGIDAQGIAVEIPPGSKEVALFHGRNSRKALQREAEAAAKHYAKRLAKDPALQARNIVEIRWSLRSGPHNHRMKERKKGRVTLARKAPQT